MKTTTALIAAIMALTVSANPVLFSRDVPACTNGQQVDGQNPIGPWTELSNCENDCYFQEEDQSNPNYQMQCKGNCQYTVPACGTSVCPTGYYTCTPQ